MKFNLTKEQTLIQRTAREFAEKTVAPLVDNIEAEHHIPMELFTKAAELGLLSIPFAEEYGGAEGGYDGYVLALEQIGKVSSSVSMAIMAHVLGMSIIDTFGTNEQKQMALPPGCRGEHLTSFAFTEPVTGSDPKQITSTGKREGDYYVLNGTKRFITNAAYPGFMGVVVREVDSGQLTTFMIDKRLEGYTTSEPWEKIAMNGGQLLDLYFKDYKIPVENMMGKVGDGFHHLEAGVGYGKLGISAFCLGLAEAAYEASLEYVTQKTHRDKPIVKFQAIQLMIAEMYQKLEAARLILYKAATDANVNSKTNQAHFARDCAMTKDFVSNTAREIVGLCMDIHGSYGLMKDYKVERMYRESIMMPQIEGVRHIQKIIVANSILADYK
ncbi:MAG: acyl-CoA dehydrogenase [Syntrophomonadaceae bacterium]|nr:acyl-CoA dehydrogenase [Syntrophomonadaceae bacterium]